MGEQKEPDKQKDRHYSSNVSSFLYMDSHKNIKMHGKQNSAGGGHEQQLLSRPGSSSPNHIITSSKRTGMNSYL